MYTSFTLCQASTVRHWNRVLADTTDTREHRGGADLVVIAIPR
ncbi:hypothetical protein [Amycolatopsis sp. FBCC-B4732]|nr:hypothetical protein [Amycolatopsis sp. FBCC-B4732]